MATQSETVVELCNRDQSVSITDVMRLWICRLLLIGQGYRAMDDMISLLDDEAYRLIGLNPKRVAEDHEYGRVALSETLESASERAREWPRAMRAKLAALGGRLGLNDIEQETLGFLAMMAAHNPLWSAARNAGRATQLDHADIVAIALDRPSSDISPILKSDARLTRSGLLRLAMTRSSHNPRLKEELEIPAFTLLDGLATAITSNLESIEDLLRGYFRRSESGDSGLLDFSHCERQARHISALVEHALGHAAVGLNVLVHGDTGVGKTEFVRALGHRCGWDLHEVSTTGRDHDSLMGPQRFRALQLGQFMLEGSKRGVLLFDEIEDVFDPRFASHLDTRSGGRVAAGKGWTNRLLESTSPPVIWVSNSVEMLDPAYLRRFDYIFEMQAPGRPVRARMLDEALDGTCVSSEWVEARATDADMTPARISQLGRLARRVESALPAAEIPQLLDEQLAQQRAAKHSQPPNSKRRTDPLGAFELDYVNTSTDCGSLVRGLAQQGSGTVLMHGPPGTGKTTLAEYVADQLDRELMVRSASELLGMFVGESEKALAGMFLEAVRSDAVLMLDEADNFLAARAGARNRWEVTQTNELLVQMERFPGIFLCATNLLENLDPAAMRRFDVKLEFDYLNPDQVWALFRKLLGNTGMSCPRGHAARRLRERLARLDQLAPGDFAAVARRTALLGEVAKDPKQVVLQLESEQAMKPGAGGIRPGFV